MTVNQILETKPENIRVGDVITASWKGGDGFSSALYTDQEVKEIIDDYVITETCWFSKESTTFYVTKKAVRKLPTAVGVRVKHEDGWEFVRSDENHWFAIAADDVIEAKFWTDEEVNGEPWTEVTK